MAAADVQDSINQLTQSTTILLPDMLFFDSLDQLNTMIKTISTKPESASTIAEQIPKLQA